MALHGQPRSLQHITWQGESLNLTCQPYSIGNQKTDLFKTCKPSSSNLNHYSKKCWRESHKQLHLRKSFVAEEIAQRVKQGCCGSLGVRPLGPRADRRNNESRPRRNHKVCICKVEKQGAQLVQTTLQQFPSVAEQITTNSRYYLTVQCIRRSGVPTQAP